MTTSMSRKARSQCIQQRTEEDDGTATKPNPTLSQALPAFPDITHDEEDPEFQAEARIPSSSSPKAPVVVLDNDGDKKVVDPSRRSAQESIEHAKYWALPDRLDDEGWLPPVNAASGNKIQTRSEYMAGCTYPD
ncbi:hypothetical protein P3342_009115 [Pyrenophora teres f. teres]|nr:hypothetical protein P3342_009115 [Pyrenophora teres f. teres]